MIKSLLKELNFSEKETKVYLALMELGSAKARDISLKADLNRTTIYDVCEELLSRGLISTYKKGSTTYFNALEPKRLVNYLEREKADYESKIEKQKKKVKNLLPELISLQNLPTAKPKVRFFEGAKGVREAYEDTLSAKEMILAYANVQTMHEGLPDFFPEYYKRRAAKKIFIRAICPQNNLSIERSKYDQEEMREVRFLPDKAQTFSPEINLYHNKMLVASWKEKMAVILESKELVDLQKLTYNMIWESLPRHK
ncbi:hypothetical protein KKC60_03815 [Patescibacteria group bacterium]|nr:hypothetical protein [Patescibacteria group bacterium]